MTLNEILAQAGKNINDIKQIYHGKDHACRCGCCGKYFEKGEKGYIRAINAMNKEGFETYSVDIATNRGYNHINIPYNSDADKCYCIYFN